MFVLLSSPAYFYFLLPQRRGGQVDISLTQRRRDTRGERGRREEERHLLLRASLAPPLRRMVSRRGRRRFLSPRFVTPRFRRQFLRLVVHVRRYTRAGVIGEGEGISAFTTIPRPPFVSFLRGWRRGRGGMHGKMLYSRFFKLFLYR